MQVYIYGLSDTEVLEELGQPSDGQVWTLNDYYQFHTWLKPDRIYNLHYFPYVHADQSRFSGDWKAEYNKSGALVKTIERIGGVYYQRRINESRLADTAGGKKYLRCSIATMIYEASTGKDCDCINLRGVALNKSEYRNQAWGILRAIDFVRKAGGKIHVLPLGRETEWRKMMKIVPFNPGAMGDIDLTYWESAARSSNIKLNKEDLEVNCDND